MKSSLGTRAVVRKVEAGQTAPCAACGRPTLFSSWRRQRKVVANVYVDGRWDRVEQYHFDCCRDAGEPHGAAL